MKVLSIPVEKSKLPNLKNQEIGTIRAYNPNRKIALPTMEGLSFERIKEIICLEAKGNYTLIHFKGGRKQLVCRTLRDMEDMLYNDRRFARIHRSHTVNLDYLQKYIKGKGGYVILEGGMNISVSSGRKQSFMDAVTVYFR
jgi:two-component system LytT family response regulator